MADSSAIRAGKAFVELTLKDDTLQAGLDKAMDRIKGFAIGAAAAGAAVFAAASALVATQMESIDVTAKVADRLGVTTEALAGMRHAANLAGVGADEFDSTLEKLSKNLGEAAAKGGPAADALKDLGLDAKALAAIPVDQAMRQIADGIKGVGNASERSRLAVEIFGKTGQSLINVLSDGAEGFDKAQEEAEKYGLAVSRVDAAKVEAANDAITRAGAVIQGIGSKIAVELAPYIEAAANKMIELATSGEGLKNKVGPALEYVVQGIAAVADAAADLKVVWDFTILGIEALTLGMVSAIIQGIEQVLQSINELAGTELSLGDEAKSFASNIDDDLKSKVADINAELAKPPPSVAILSTFKEIKDKAQEAADAVAKTHGGNGGGDAPVAENPEIKKTTDALKEQVLTVGMSKAGLLEHKLAMMGATEAQIKNALAIEKDIEKLEAMQKAQDLATENAKKVTDTIDGLSESIRLYNTDEGGKQVDLLTKLGATPDQIAKVKDLQKTLKELNAGKEIDSAQQEIDDFGKTDAQKRIEKFSKSGATQDQIAKYSDLVNKGEDLKATANMRSSTAGTFSSAALYGLGMGGSEAKETAQNTKKSADLLMQVAQKLSDALTIRVT